MKKSVRMSSIKSSKMWLRLLSTSTLSYEIITFFFKFIFGFLRCVHAKTKQALTITVIENAMKVIDIENIASALSSSVSLQ
jgi:hypothetical protein